MVAKGVCVRVVIKKRQWTGGKTDEESTAIRLKKSDDGTANILSLTTLFHHSSFSSLFPFHYHSHALPTFATTLTPSSPFHHSHAPLFITHRSYSLVFVLALTPSSPLSPLPHLSLHPSPLFHSLSSPSLSFCLSFISSFALFFFFTYSPPL